ncbi:hypothetical protein HDU76_013721 [Blyttiomyces sp. JEL0837]|nr:hypothetical protein HDU76_013721 [Blyttiomyces sp. JEL0837]
MDFPPTSPSFRPSASPRIRDVNSFDRLCEPLGPLSDFPEMDSVLQEIKSMLDARNRLHVLESGGSTSTPTLSDLGGIGVGRPRSYSFSSQASNPADRSKLFPRHLGENLRWSNQWTLAADRSNANGTTNEDGSTTSGWPYAQISGRRNSHDSESSTLALDARLGGPAPSWADRLEPIKGPIVWNFDTTSPRIGPGLGLGVSGMDFEQTNADPHPNGNQIVPDRGDNIGQQGRRSQTPAMNVQISPVLDSGDISVQTRLPGALDEDDEDEEQEYEGPVDPSLFLHTLLRVCKEGLVSVPKEDAIIACQLGLDFIKVMDNGVADQISSAISIASYQSSGGSTTGSRTVKSRKLSKYGRMPYEILHRVLNFLSENSEAADQNIASPMSHLYACSLVCRHWYTLATTELWKRITMGDDAPRLGRFVFSLASSTTFSRSSITRRSGFWKSMPTRGSLVRVMSVSCTDAELSLLSTAAPYLTSLHSLELRHSLIPSAASYRLLDRLATRFPSLRSLVADMIPPSSFADIVSLVRSSRTLSNLHISIGSDPRSINPTTNQAPPNNPIGRLAPTPTTATTMPHSHSTDINIIPLFSNIPNLSSLSLWRVKLPRDEGLWVPSLSTSCPHLRAIRIDDCGDISMDVLVGLWRRCNLLECIVMRKVRRRAAFTDLLPRPTMIHVVLDACWMNDALCAAIGANAPNLEAFYLEDDWADDDFRHPMAPTVVTDLTDYGVLALAEHQRNLKTITFIGFPGRRNFHASSLRALLDANPNCFALNLARMDPQWAYRINDAWLLELAPSLRSIEILELYIQNGISERALIETLTVAALASVNNSTMQYSTHDRANEFGQNGGKIRRLGLSGCSQLTDATLSSLPDLCPNLERLDMAGANVTCQGLQSLVDSASRLRECVVNVPRDGDDDGIIGGGGGNDQQQDVRMRDVDENDDDDAGLEMGNGGVRWGKVMQYDDPVSEEVFSPYAVWERFVRSRLGRQNGIVY